MHAQFHANFHKSLSRQQEHYFDYCSQTHTCSQNVFRESFRGLPETPLKLYSSLLIDTKRCPKAMCALLSRMAMSSRLQIVREPSQQMVHGKASLYQRRERAGASSGHQMSSWDCLQTSMQISTMTLQAHIQVQYWHTCNMGMHLPPHGAAMTWL